MPCSAEWYFGLLDADRPTDSSRPKDKHDSKYIALLFKCRESGDSTKIIAPKKLVFHRDPSIDQEIDDDGVCTLYYDSLASAKIFAYWIFNGRLPDAVFESEIDFNAHDVLPAGGSTDGNAAKAGAQSIAPTKPSSSSPSPASAQQPQASSSSAARPAPTPARAWIDAWLFGQQRNITEFQDLITKRLSTVRFSVEDYHYVNHKVRPEDVSINPLTAIANNAVLDLLQEDAISFKDFGKLLFYDAPKCVGLADALMQYVVENPRPSSRKGRKKRASSSMWTTAVQEEASRIFREVLEEILEIQVGKESEGDTKTDEEIKEAKEENSEASKQGKGRQAPKGKGNANA